MISKNELLLVIEKEPVLFGIFILQMILPFALGYWAFKLSRRDKREKLKMDEEKTAVRIDQIVIGPVVQISMMICKPIRSWIKKNFDKV